MAKKIPIKYKSPKEQEEQRNRWRELKQKSRLKLAAQQPAKKNKVPAPKKAKPKKVNKERVRAQKRMSYHKLCEDNKIKIRETAWEKYLKECYGK